MFTLENLKLFEDRILVEIVIEEKSKSGLIIPNAQASDMRKGIVRLSGPGTYRIDGSFADMALEAGDHVLLERYGGQEIKIDGKDYFLLRETDVIGYCFED